MSSEEELSPARRWIDYQRSLNQEGEGSWSDYAEHRNWVTGTVLELLRETPPGERRVNVLGAGNANDIDLALLSQTVSHLTLTDIDESAMTRAVRRHGLSTGPRLTLRVQDLSETSQLIGPEARASIVVSACVLTQLLDRQVQMDGLSTSGDALGQVLIDTRDEHLALLDRFASASGRRLLLTDMVSSLTCPQLDQAGPSDLVQLLRSCIRDGNFFTGTNPEAIRARLMAQGHREARFIGPWRWTMGRTSRLVYGVLW